MDCDIFYEYWTELSIKSHLHSNQWTVLFFQQEQANNMENHWFSFHWNIWHNTGCNTSRIFVLERRKVWWNWQIQEVVWCLTAKEQTLLFCLCLGPLNSFEICFMNNDTEKRLKQRSKGFHWALKNICKQRCYYVGVWEYQASKKPGEKHYNFEADVQSWEYV